MNKCLMEIGRGSWIVLIGDMNGRVGNMVMIDYIMVDEKLRK